MTDEAFTQAARAYGDTIYRVAYHALGSPHDAEDVMQTVLLRLYECKKDFESEEHMKRWLLRVAVNESRKQQRAFWRRTSVPLEEWRETAAPEDPERAEALRAVEASVEDRDGRAILVIDGEDVADITDELKSDGRYYYEDTTDAGTYLTVAVEGWVDDWTAAVSIGDGEGPAYTFSGDSEGNGSAGAPTVPVEETDGFTISSSAFSVKKGVFVTEDD